MKNWHKIALWSVVLTSLVFGVSYLRAPVSIPQEVASQVKQVDKVKAHKAKIKKSYCAVIRRHSYLPPEVMADIAVAKGFSYQKALAYIKKCLNQG